MRNLCLAALAYCIAFATAAQDTRITAKDARKQHLAESKQFFHKKTSAEPVEVLDPSGIDIVRDRYGVPHIFAATDPQVAYGLAWAHSEDDFYTIQKSFLASRAILGLHAGREGATIDYIVQLLRIPQLVDSLYESSISPYYKTVLEGYCDGFNAFAKTHPKEVLEKRLFPVTPKDVIGYSVLQLAIGCGVDEALKKIYKGKIELAFDEGMENVPSFIEAEGSNAFAFNSNKTRDGNTYLVINTHHPLDGQVAWYEAHVSSEQGWNITGALFPGSPVLFTGINENLAWTHTVNHPDKLDVYQLETDPDDPTRYRYDGQWLHLQESFARLKVKVPGFNLQMKKKVYWSVYGPTVLTEQGAFSIRTAGFMDIRGLEQWFWMNKARNFHEFHQALKMEALPGYNVVYADRFDTIYYLSNGRLPIREKGFNWTKTVPGNTSKTRWTNFYSLEELPQLVNPPSGYVYNTNHSPFKATSDEFNINGSDYDSLMGYETFDNNRSLRVQELIGRDKIDYEQFKRIKYDLQLPSKLAFPVDIHVLFTTDYKAHEEVADLLLSLQRWDRKGNVESIGATHFASFFYEVADKYLADPTYNFVTEDQCIDILKKVKKDLVRNFGTINVPLGDYQRLVRSDKSMALPGLPDVLAAMYSTSYDNGTRKGAVGDCFIGFVQYTKSGPVIETVNCFGSSNRIGSKHYADQMELFQAQKTKRMYLNRADVIRHAESIYHPEVLTPMSAKVTRARR